MLCSDAHNSIDCASKNHLLCILPAIIIFVDPGKTPRHPTIDTTVQLELESVDTAHTVTQVDLRVSESPVSSCVYT